jgi:hypothetical protein
MFTLGTCPIELFPNCISQSNIVAGGFSSSKVSPYRINIMSATIEDLTINYEEDGVQVVKETGKEVLSKGAWTTILFRFQNLDRKTGEFGKDMYTIRRYQKRQGEYLMKSKFNISSSEQAKKIIEILEKWTSED